MKRRVKLMNTFVDSYDMKGTINEMKKIIKTRTITQHVVVNANKINLMYEDDKLQDIVSSCSLINADGKSIVWANKFLKSDTLIHRVTGIDLFEELIRVSEEEGYRIFYLGAKDETVKCVVDKHRRAFPQLNIVGFHHGYFDKENCDEVIEEIRQSHADILFVAFPSPTKEYWLNKYKYDLNVPLQIGVGGSFDVVSGNIKRAPLWVQTIGMEWFYRWIFEPRRLFKRYFIGNTKFVAHLFSERKKLKNV